VKQVALEADVDPDDGERARLLNSAVTRLVTSGEFSAFISYASFASHITEWNHLLTRV
jgi:hypothetical protein